MLRSMRRRPSPGTILGLLALFVSLGGVAFAQGTPTTPTPPAGPPSTVPVAEALHALTADEAKRSPVDQIVYVVDSEEVSDNTASSSLNMQCPAGMNVIAGGLTTEGGGGSRDFETVYSGPSSNRSWIVRYNPSDDDTGEVVRGTAICVNAAYTRSDGHVQ